MNTGDETIIPGARLKATDRTGGSSSRGTNSGKNPGGSGGGSNITIDKKKSFYHLKGPSTNFHRYQAATVR